MSEMHPEFPSWYSHVDLENNSERRQARWNAIEKYIETEEVDVELLLKLVHSFRQKPTGDQLNEFRHYFRDEDETFSLSGNDKELQLLAGSCLAELASQNGRDQSAETALAIITADFCGAREMKLPIDLASIANKAMTSKSIESRRRPTLSSPRTALTKISLKETAESVVNSWDQVSKAFLSTEAIINEKVLPQIQESRQSIRNIHKYLAIQDEELQMLWWVVGEFSHSMNCPFSKLEENSKPLVLAAELSKETKFMPGPVAINALLSRAGLIQSKKVKITSAVNSAEEEWLRSQVDGKNISPLTTPIHFAIARQLETGAGDSWVAGWSAATQINKGFSVSALDLGMLYYRESLLATCEQIND